MAEAQQIAEPTESVTGEPNGKNKSLPELLGEWDEHKRPASEPEVLPEDVVCKSDSDDEIRGLKAANGDLTERLVDGRQGPDDRH